jgi:hypothetical protein
MPGILSEGSGVGPTARRPLLRWWHAVDDDVIHLGKITFAIILLHDDAAELEARSKDLAFEGESVIAVKGMIRAHLCVLVVCPRCGTH